MGGSLAPPKVRGRTRSTVAAVHRGPWVDVRYCVVGRTKLFAYRTVELLCAFKDTKVHPLLVAGGTIVVKQPVQPGTAPYQGKPTNSTNETLFLALPLSGGGKMGAV